MAVLDGFSVAEVEIPVPLIPVGDAARDRLRLVVAAIAGQECTPEDIAAALQDGWPLGVEAMVADALTCAELDAFIDLLLVVQQTPV